MRDRWNGGLLEEAPVKRLEPERATGTKTDRGSKIDRTCPEEKIAGKSRKWSGTREP